MFTIPDTKVTRASVYKAAGEARYREAEFLKEEHPSGSIYLAGYLVECLLKWALCKRNGVQYLQALPDKRLVDMLTSGKGHNLETLCGKTGYDIHFDRNEEVRKAFLRTAQWSPNIRYIASCGGRSEAGQFLAAVRILRKDIESWATK